MKNFGHRVWCRPTLGPFGGGQAPDSNHKNNVGRRRGGFQ